MKMKMMKRKEPIVCIAQIIIIGPGGGRTVRPALRYVPTYSPTQSKSLVFYYYCLPLLSVCM